MCCYVLMGKDSPFSPTFRKLTGEVVAKCKHRRFTRRIEICLEEWWLSRPGDGKGLAVSGRPIENRKFIHSAPAKTSFASREFHSTKIMKRHGCTILETFDGFIISLCGFINKSRSQQNGFSSEVCRVFICGFPYNWEDYGEASMFEESSRKLDVNIMEYNGGQLHDLMLSLSDAERDVFNKKVYADLIGMLDSQTSDESEAQPSNHSPTSTPLKTNASKKRQRDTLLDVSHK